MEDLKLEYTEPDKVYETVDTIKNEQPQYRYYEVEVSRRQIAYVTVRVPYDQKFDYRTSNSQKIVAKAVDETVQNYEWENEYPQSIEIEGIKEMTEDEATVYDVYEA
jgi:hypothetical protein